MPRASTSPGWKRATACSTAAAAPAAGSAPCASPSPRPKAAERTPPPEPGGGALGWRHGRPLGAGPGRRSIPQGIQASSPPIRPPPPGARFPPRQRNSPFGSGGMVQAPRRTGFSGPLVRLLARLTDVDAPNPTIPFRPAQPLAGLDGRHRAAAVLDGKPPAMAPGGPTFDSEQDRESLKLRTTLADAIASDTEFTAARPRGRQLPSRTQAVPKAPTDADYPASASATCRCSTRWRTASAACAAARHAGRTQSGNDPAGDGGRHHGKIAQRARTRPHDDYSDAARRAFRAAAQGRAIGAGRSRGGGNAAAGQAGAWLDTFRKDMRSVLLAELDIRFQPVEGLLAALRTR